MYVLFKFLRKGQQVGVYHFKDFIHRFYLWQASAIAFHIVTATMFIYELMIK